MTIIATDTPIQTRVVSIRMPEKLYWETKAAAAQDRRTLSNFIECALAKAVRGSIGIEKDK